MPLINKHEKSNKKSNTKPRAMSNNEELLVVNAPKIIPNRERAQTESIIIIKPLNCIPPPLSKEKPWGEAMNNVTNFNQLQTEETKDPLKINKWIKHEEKIDKPLSFSDLQVEEKDSNELDEALLLIACMESLET